MTRPGRCSSSIPGRSADLHPDAGLGHLSTRIGVGMSAYPLDGPVPELSVTESHRIRQKPLLNLAKRENLTVQQPYRHVCNGARHHTAVGTPVRSLIGCNTSLTTVRPTVSIFCPLSARRPGGRRSPGLRFDSRMVGYGMAAVVKVCGWRPHDGDAACTGGRRPQTSKGGNRGRVTWVSRLGLWGF